VARRPALERQIDEAIGRWAAEGLLELTDYRGAPLLRTPLPKGRGVWFDEEAVERVLRFFLLLRQLVGRWAGRRFILLDWQVRYLVAPAFGIKGPDGLRIIRTVWFEIPRKNGKSTLCSGLALYLTCADREPAAQVFAAAKDRNQARLVFAPSRQMALGSPELVKALGKGILKTYIEHPRTHSIFRPISSDFGAQQGLNVHGAVIDEVHVHRTSDVIDALETGTGSREQPLILFITTADDGADGSIYATKRTYLEALVAGHFRDDSWYGCVFGADEQADGFDPFSEATLAAANPGAGVTVLWPYLLKKAEQARNSPTELNRYLRLHLNVRTRQTVRWIDLAAWDMAAGVDPAEEMAGLPAWGGLDLSATTDFTAAAIVARDESTRGRFLARTLFWLPEERADYIATQTGMPIRRWAAAGWVNLTEGNVVDYEQVRADFAAEVKRLGVVLTEVAYDPWNATETVLKMQDDGYAMVPVRQGYASLNAPCKAFERAIYGSTPELSLFQHGGNPVLRWMADCVEVRQDEAGNLKPSKPDRRKSAKRIDGIAACVNALSRAIAGDEDLGSAYDDDDLMVV
jgi:phage terminase large subunit-like protein